ncbi:hypothetical protein D9M73_294540 [compost metagenome]
MVIRGAFVQLHTPDEMRGRVSAVNGLFIGASNQLGEFESGVTVAWFGTVPAVVMGGGRHPAGDRVVDEIVPEPGQARQAALSDRHISCQFAGQVCDLLSD